LNATANNRIYVSDLDGTLLRNDATISPYTRDKLCQLLDSGVHFTIASARSLSSLRPILEGIDFPLPIIEINGAFISDFSTGRHLVVNNIDSRIVERIFSCVTAHELLPFVSTFNGKGDCLYFQDIINPAMQWYLDDRRANKDKRLRQVDDITVAFNDDVISFNVMGPRRQVELLAGQLDRLLGERLENFFFENPYSPGWWWLTIHDRKACKSIAVRELLELAGFSMDDLTVFGDNINDVKMFRTAARAVAVANATDEVKQYAHHVIGSNEEDSVVRFVLQESNLPLD